MTTTVTATVGPSTIPTATPGTPLLVPTDDSTAYAGLPNLDSDVSALLITIAKWAGVGVGGVIVGCILYAFILHLVRRWRGRRRVKCATPSSSVALSRNGTENHGPAPDDREQGHIDSGNRPVFIPSRARSPDAPFEAAFVEVPLTRWSFDARQEKEAGNFGEELKQSETTV
ncbi:hypothetical protein BJ742DRAFT_818077 [Cladochytrium replicatum]|nr:hypothetical protein BJ742DRAFT_818077 [Cladochytrium replicatum]